MPQEPRYSFPSPVPDHLQDPVLTSAPFSDTLNLPIFLVHPIHLHQLSIPGDTLCQGTHCHSCLAMNIDNVESPPCALFLIHSLIPSQDAEHFRALFLLLWPHYPGNPANILAVQHSSFLQTLSIQTQSFESAHNT